MHIYLSQTFNTIIKSKQALIIPDSRKETHITLPRPTPRSGWKVSLRRAPFA